MGAPRNRSNTGKYKAVKELQETGKTQVNIKQFGSFKKQELHSKIKCSLGASEAETTQVKKAAWKLQETGATQINMKQLESFKKNKQHR